MRDRPPGGGDPAEGGEDGTGRPGSGWPHRPGPPEVLAQGPGSPAAEEVRTAVLEENGRWAVDIIVVFPDGVVRRRIDTYPTRRRAEISARLIRRGAEREIRGPVHD